jgi:hypothetical protein
MTITVDIRPEIEAELARQAAACGLGIGAYAAALLEEAATHLPVVSTEPGAAAEAKDMVELFAALRGLNLNFERDTKPFNNLSDLLLSSPLAGANLNLERSKGQPRPIDLG